MMITSIGSLWLPIVVSTVGVFFASSLIHMVLKWHNSDYLKLPNEDAVRATVGKPAPGQYVIPYCVGMEEMKKPEMQQKFAEGPVAFLLVKPNGMPVMGAALGQWFGLNAVIAVVIAYMAMHALPMTNGFLSVCRFTGGAAFLAHAVGPVTNAIWMGRSWNSVVKDALDAAIYATVTAVSFGALWPHP
jgi:hypothetical protein